MHYTILNSCILAIFSAGLCLVVKRLVFSPLKNIPGPRLAAATRWYETYFDIIREGQFMYEIQRLHQIYGPVVRIGPNEIHINDPNFYDILYAGPTHRRHKDTNFISSIAPGTSFSTVDSHYHRGRRSGLSPFFSKKAIRELEPAIRANVKSLCGHFQRAQSTAEILELHACFVNFAVDTVSEYVFGSKFGFGTLKKPVVDKTWKHGVNSIFELMIPMRHFRFIYPLTRALPKSISELLYPKYCYISPIELAVRQKVDSAACTDSRDSESSILGHLIYNDRLPATERSPTRLFEEILFLQVAGSDAPSQVMAITMFHIINNSAVYKSLKKELREHFPDENAEVSWTELEELPYLTAVIKEGLRLSAVVTSRLPRIAPDEDLVCHGWQIPRGTVISMSNHFILRDTDIFPDPLSFSPERWLSPSSYRLEKYLVPFSKGSQGCIGPNMAYCWFYMMFSTLFRRFDWKLVDTDESNVTIVRDCFNGQTPPGKNNIQVQVL